MILANCNTQVQHKVPNISASF